MQKSSNKNRRSLDAIADEIHKHERGNVFAVGELLIEAQDALDFGDWGPWVHDNFRSWSSADNYMAVARLGRRFPRLGNLRLARTTLYSLAGQDEDLQADIIDALIQLGAAKRQIKPAEAAQVARLTRLRAEDDKNRPDALLLALDTWGRSVAPEATEIIAALEAGRPETEEQANKIVAQVTKEVQARLNAAIANAKSSAPASTTPSRIRSCPTCRSFASSISREHAISLKKQSILGPEVTGEVTLWEARTARLRAEGYLVGAIGGRRSGSERGAGHRRMAEGPYRRMAEGRRLCIRFHW